MSSKPEEVTVTEPTVTLETLVRTQLSKALGGKRGMLEGAIPTLGFTVTWITTHNLNLSLVISAGLAVVLLLHPDRAAVDTAVRAELPGRHRDRRRLRAAVRSGRGRVPARASSTTPSTPWSLGASALVRWPLVGFMIGGVTGDLTRWHEDRHLVSLCCKLTWLLALPCLLRVVVQYPLYAAAPWPGGSGVAKIAMGWPLQVAALGAMVWLLSRDNTPVPVAGPEDRRRVRLSRTAGHGPPAERTAERVSPWCGRGAGGCAAPAAGRGPPRSRAT